MTARGLCLLVPGLAGTAAGLFLNHTSLSTVSLAVVLWMMLEWLWFQVRQVTELSAIQVHRTINGRANATGVCFADRNLTIQITIRSRRGSLRPWTRIRDMVPDMLSIAQGEPVKLVNQTEKEVTFHYSCCPRSAGTALFSGCRIRIQDPNGFFVADRFIAMRQMLTILPGYDTVKDPQPQIKRLNGLPQHGIHRLQRAGMGSELLELREYVPGDPPKSIAWKVSARRDKLMTREYESEVPVRTIIFVDDSVHSRLGFWGTRLCDASGRLAASVAKTALSAGDPAGLTVFSDTEVTRLAPGWGERTLFRILDKLAHCCRTETGTVPWTPDLQRHALAACRDHYPELLDARINQIPWTVFPLLPWKRRLINTRSLLAGVLCQVHGLHYADWVRLVYDDDYMGQHLCRLLSSAGYPGTIPTSVSDGMHCREQTLSQLATALRQAVSQARDNEHYVIICDLLGREELLEIVRPAIQLARARHHRLAFVCPLAHHQTISGNGNDPPTAPLLLHEAWQIEQQERQDQLTRELRSMGIPVVFADRDRQASMVLADLKMTRTARATAGVR